MNQNAYVDLPDGRRLDYVIRTSARARRVLLKMTVWEGLTVVVPRGVGARQVARLVANKRGWIAEKLEQFDEVRQQIGDEASALPKTFDLPALAESWQVEYQAGEGKSIGVRTVQPGHILLYGAVAEDDLCKEALRRWLSRHAREALTPWMEALAAETGLRYARVAVRNQRTRWGSCSTSGAINLNCKLLFLPPRLARYVMLHELCHTLEHNHTRRFWDHLQRFEPDSDMLRCQMREVWQQIPLWAHPVRAGR